MKKLIVYPLALFLIFAATNLFAGGQRDGEQSQGGVQRTITYTTWNLTNDEWSPFYQKDFAEFEAAHPEHEIVPLVIPYEQYFDKIVTLIASGSPPDIIGNLAPYLAIFIESDQLQPINEYVDTSIIERDYFPSNANRRGDTYYGIPFGGRTMQLLYNKKLFAEAGVSIPTTHEELMAVAKKLTDQSKGMYGYALQTNVANYDDTYESLVTHTMSFGGNFAKDGKPIATDPNTITGVEYFKELLDAGVSPVNVPKSTIRELFFAEKLAMMIDGPWIPGLFDLRNPAAAGNISAADNPWQNKVAPGGVHYFFVIPRRASNKTGAGKYLAWTMRPEWHQELTMKTGLPGGRKDSITPGLLKSKPFLEAYIRGMDKYAFSVEPEGFEAQSIVFMKTVNDYLGKILYSNESIPKTMEVLQKELSKLQK